MCILKTVAAVIASALLPGALAVSAHAQVGANINISPKRIVLGETDRSATVYVFNQGDKPARYRVDLDDRTMTAAGNIVPVEPGATAPVASARDLVDYTPHVITLQPRQSQSIRIRVRRPEAPGEYRSHLTVTAQPPENFGLTAAQAAAGMQSNALTVNVMALFSLSIPVIVRSGPISATAGIENVRLAAGPDRPRPSIALELVRRGTGSIFGDIEVFSERGKQERQIALVRGIAVYPELQRRNLTIPLEQPLHPGERLRIAYRDQDIRPGVELAAVSLQVP